MLRTPLSRFQAAHGKLPSAGVLLLPEEALQEHVFCKRLPAAQLEELKASKVTVVFSGCPGVPSFANVDAVILASMGPEKKLTRDALRKAVHSGISRVKALKRDAVAVAFGVAPPVFDGDGLEAFRVVTTVSVLSDWAFDGSVTLASKKKTHLSLLVIDDGDGSGGKVQAIEEASLVAECTCFARDLANTRGDVATPAYMEAKAKELCKGAGELLSVSVVDFDAMKAKGMGLISAVGQAASCKPRIVCLNYNGDPSSSRRLALIGKGVTFDTGGLNLKGTGAIEKMYIDKHGACTVLGIMQGLLALCTKANVVGVMALAENAIGPLATKPHEILTSYKGLTVQNNNTDAEGRLCLADTMTHVQHEFKDVDTMFDFATLTGACVVALGPYAAGMYCTDDAVAQEMFGLGLRTGERVWRMPLFSDYNDEIRSNSQCDLQSTGKGPAGGSCTAAAFLSNFVEEGVNWAHFDIAGAAMPAEPRGHVNAGGNGWGVELVLRYIQQTRAAPAAKAKL